MAGVRFGGQQPDADLPGIGLAGFNPILWKRWHRHNTWPL